MVTIREDYVSFETAKLLKEKGFEGYSIITTYDKDAANAYIKELQEKHLPYNSDDPKLKEFYYTMPTLQMAMKWLREVHKVHIIAEPCLGEGSEPNLSFNRWFWTILKEEGEYKPIRKIDEFPTYEEACKAAIKYYLENLI